MNACLYATKTLAMKIFKLLFAFLFFTLSIIAQEQIVIEPCYEGMPLQAEIVGQFTPATVPTYATSRDIMYTEIDNTAGNLSCIYSNYTIFVDPNSSTPRSDAFDLGINCEHTYPQSKGASVEPARSNMHHLFPCKENVNADRSNCPFDENPDGQTGFWYLNDQILNSVPTTMIDAYSEKIGTGFACGTFEPRESVKGDIARAVFYFYTIYRDEADTADPDFFDLQKEQMLQWHYQDPVDQKEFDRTQAIANYQDDKANPFVLDSTLARRIYFLPDAVSMGPECFTLIPVTWEFFKVSSNDHSVNLTWQTASELNNDYFLVERSSDGHQYKEIAQIAGNGTTNTVSKYSFQDVSPVQGRNYYRLKQVDADGHFQYSEIRSIDVKVISSITIFPNPVKHTLIVDGLPDRPNGNVQIINSTGKSIQQMELLNIESQYIIDLKHLPKGIYFLLIAFENQKQTYRFIKI